MDTTHNNAEHWLPPHFPSDDDFLSDAGDRSFTKEPPKNFDLFSNAFEFDPSDKELDNYNDGRELLAELTRQLALSSLLGTRRTHHATAEKPWIFSTSQQSTLTGFAGYGSPSQVPSPPLTTPEAKNGTDWELLYEAANQVARLKMNAIAAQLKHAQHRGPLPNSSLTKAHTHNASNQFQRKMNSQGRQEWYGQQNLQGRASGGGGLGALGLPASAWPPVRTEPQHPNHHQQQSRQSTGLGMRGVFMGLGPEAPAKRQSTGTGVFLPRTVGTTQPKPRKMPAGCSTVLLPARVVQALNLDLDEINNGFNHNSRSRFGAGFANDHDVLIARRNAVLNQQRQSIKPESVATMVVGGHDFGLPSDWTY